jgi:hypothetical protein
LRKAGQAIFAFGPARADARQRCLDEGPQGTARSVVGRRGKIGERMGPGSDGLTQRARLETRLGQPPPESERDAAGPLLGRQAVDDQVRDRDFLGSDPVDAQQPQDGPLDGNRRVGGDELADRIDDRRSKVAALLNDAGIETQLHSPPILRGGGQILQAPYEDARTSMKTPTSVKMPAIPRRNDVSGSRT